ncbi:hypothetical protein NVV95_02625 [Herbiconiux sp. CPCC 205716]|uniref:Uncharacterized protein n=1 Tax=Herbiconiux gentiana TaxID=2970912 RepID=A0ABT2GB70_9MICO|nr:hypothetical protein [Herbiconiux gentiana]MCS5713444.1 hypothetical protein [Herbiconiux gentiana]
MALLTNITAVRAPRHEAATPIVAPLSWATPESKLWIASRSGEYAGMIEYTEGHFLATGSTGFDLGGFSDLGQAMSAVDRGPIAGRLPVGVLSNVAIVSAVVALSMVGMGLTVIAA